jgi:hypothetical protein
VERSNPCDACSAHNRIPKKAVYGMLTHDERGSFVAAFFLIAIISHFAARAYYINHSILISLTISALTFKLFNPLTFTQSYTLPASSTFSLLWFSDKG